MCGIIGGIGRRSKDFVELNLNSLIDRGPDSRGVLHFNSGLSLGATRLAMTDPNPRSNQPMQDSMSKNAIVFNGEVYNFRKIRKDLTHKGISFNTESDTEVVMKAVAEYGIDYLKNFEGMFSFCYYNQEENYIILARDYLGKKPLYYANGKDFFFFSSKISLIKKYLRSTNIDNSSVCNYLKLGYVVDPNTMFQEIKSVEPGQAIKIEINSTDSLLKISFTPNSIITPRVLTIRESLKESLSERIIGHDSFAISLSGGVDSTVIAILAAEMGNKCKTYSMTWSDSDKNRYNSDSNAAKLISKKLGLEFESVEMYNINLLPEIIDRFVFSMEEPNSNPSGVSMMALYERIQNDGNRLVLTGDGSDEVFGGYNRYQKINTYSWIPKFSYETLKKYKIEMNSKSKFLQEMALIMSKHQNSEHWLYWHQLASNDYLKKIYNQFDPVNFDVEKDQFFKMVLDKNSSVASTMLRDLRIWLTMESNKKLDRISMAHSIEARSPFQSENLIGNGFRNMEESNFKLLNKKILRNEFPELLDLPIIEMKMGFTSPLGHWLRRNNDLIFESINYLRKYFDFNFNEIEKLSKSPVLGNYKDFSLLWALIILARWHNYAHN